MKTMNQKKGLIFILILVVITFIFYKNSSLNLTKPSSLSKSSNLQKQAESNSSLTPGHQNSEARPESGAANIGKPLSDDELAVALKNSNNEYKNAISRHEKKTEFEIDANNERVHSEIRKAIFSNVFDKTVMAFSKSAKIETNFPTDFKYQKIQIEGMEGLRATNGQAELVMVASPSFKSDAQLLNFLSNPETNLPGLSDLTKQDMERVKTFKPNPESGISDIRYIYKSNGASTTVLAIAERSDGRGQYLSIISGAAGYMESGETRFTQIVKNLRAR
jgi:hypothetical protein